MKKLGMLLAIVLFMGITQVYAMSEAELKDKLFQTIEIGNDKYGLSEDHKVLVERYLDQNEVSSEHADFIAKRIDKAIEIIKSQKSAEFKKYSKKAKEDLKALVVEISENTSVKATVTKNSVIVYNTDGTKVEVTGLVKKTGMTNSNVLMIVGISFIIVAVGTGLIIKQVKTSE